MKSRYYMPEAEILEYLWFSCICDSLVGDDNESVIDEEWEI